MLRILLIIFSTFLLISCNDGEEKPDVSKIEVDIDLKRFEKEFFAVDTTAPAAGLDKLAGNYPEFFPVFVQQFLGATSSQDPVINLFTGYHRFLYDSLMKQYDDLSGFEKELTANLRYVKHYFPSYRIPQLLTFIGPLDAPGTVVLEDAIGLGLHQFAGKDFSIYNAPEIREMYPAYITRRFDREFMLPAMMKGIASSIYLDSSVGRPLIEQMIEKGKEWYLVDKFLPDVPDSLITGFTSDQMKWTEANEANIWVHIVNTEDLYSIDPEVVQRYIGPAPFTQSLDQERSPGNLGQWIGWKIVEEYAETSGKSPAEVIKTSARVIYNEAKYKPR
jgi:hypothetical protein